MPQIAQGSVRDAFDQRLGPRGVPPGHERLDQQGGRLLGGLVEGVVQRGHLGRDVSFGTAGSATIDAIINLALQISTIVALQTENVQIGAQRPAQRHYARLHHLLPRHMQRPWRGGFGAVIGQVGQQHRRHFMLLPRQSRPFCVRIGSLPELSFRVGRRIAPSVNRIGAAALSRQKIFDAPPRQFAPPVQQRRLHRLQISLVLSKVAHHVALGY
mmetsp:Transcript_33105/g.70553  ORF Transcript_33105/g.70553 Transcript_33105/m.70553 type:complete len:214 (+) Transcript_33105:1400-2041(+)